MGTTLKPYNGFSGEQREEAGRFINKQIKAGIIRKPCKCNRCGQTEGIIHAHLEDYTIPVKQEQIEELCWRCHMMWHCRFRAPRQVEAYFAEVAAGKRWPAVYKHNFNILTTDHGL